MSQEQDLKRQLLDLDRRRLEKLRQQKARAAEPDLTLQHQVGNLLAQIARLGAELGQAGEPETAAPGSCIETGAAPLRVQGPKITLGSITRSSGIAIGRGQNRSSRRG